MNKTTMWIIGGLGIVGIILMVTAKSSAASGSNVQLPAATPFGLPQFPAAPPMPAFSVQANPSYNYYNMPSDRNQVAPTDNTKKDGCGCGSDCGDQLTSEVSIPQSYSTKQAKQLASRWSLGPNPSTMLKQFPPAVYPWLYEQGGSA